MSQQTVAKPPKDRAPKVRESKSAAVRAALANPSKRQLTKWQRERRQRRLLLYSAAALVVAAAVILSFGYWRELIVRPNEPAAEVGDQAIPLGALALRLRPQLMALDNEIARVQSTTAPGTGANASSQQLQMLSSQRLGAIDQVLGDMIDDELIAREAERRGLEVSDAEIDARVQTEFAKQKAATSGSPAATPAAGPDTGPTPTPTPLPTLTAEEFQDTYQTLLSRVNYTDEQYRRYVAAQVRRDKVRDAVTADVAPTQEQVHARRITVGTQEEATAALADIRSGEASFEDVAREKSKDLLSKSQGGDLGWLPRGLESSQFDDQAFRLGIDEIGEPVATPQGWEIIQVLEKEQRPLTPEQLDRLKNKGFDQWLKTTRDDPGVRRELDKDKREWVMRQAGDKQRAAGAMRPGGF